MKQYEYDYSKLNGKIAEVLGDKKALAEAMNISYTTMMHRFHNRIPYTQNEIMEVCDLLHIPHSDIPLYFFTRKVSYTKTERSN